MAENPNNQGSNQERKKTSKLNTLQIRRILKQEKEIKELRKKLTTLMNYQREMDKKEQTNINNQEEIKKNNLAIHKLYQDNIKYEKALKVAQDKKDEEQSDFYRTMLLDNNVELQRLKELNNELKQTSTIVEDRLEDINDTLEDMGETFSDNFQSLIDSFNLMAIKDSMEDGIAEVSQSMKDITNSLHLSEEEAEMFQDQLKNEFKAFNKNNKNMLSSGDMQEAVAKLIESGVTNRDKLMELWESIAVADKLGYDIGSRQGIVQNIDSAEDVEIISGAMVKAKQDGLAMDDESILQALDTVMPAISNLSQEEQNRIINEMVSQMAQMQNLGISGFEDTYASMIRDMYAHPYDPNHYETYGNNNAVLMQTAGGDISKFNEGFLSNMQNALMYNADSVATEQFGLSEDTIDSLRAKNVDFQELYNATQSLASEDSIEALHSAMEDYRVGIYESLKNEIAPYLFAISNEVSDWGLEWDDITGIYLAGKGIFDGIKGLKSFFGKGGITSGINSSTATSLLARVKDIWTTVSGWFSKFFGFGSTVGTGASTAAGAVAPVAGSTAAGVASAGATVGEYFILRELYDATKTLFKSWSPNKEEKLEAKRHEYFSDYGRKGWSINEVADKVRSFFGGTTYEEDLRNEIATLEKELGITGQDTLEAILNNKNLTQEEMANAVTAGINKANVTNKSKSKSQYDTYNSHREGLDTVPADNYKATLHAGEMILTAQEADVYREGKEKQAIPTHNVNANNKSKSKSQYNTYNSHREGLDTVPADNYKATLHAGEMVLTAQEADVYRKNREKQAILTHNAQQTQSLRNKLATQENLHALRESAPALLERFKSLATAPTTDSSGGSGGSGGSGVVASSGPIDEELMFSSTEGFFQALAPAAKQGEQEYGVFAATTLAQAALESAWGKSKVAQSDKNLFGIKYTGKFAPGLNVTQGRNCPGNESGGAVPYNRYQSFGDSIIDHGWFLKNNPRYTKAGAFNAKNAKEQIQAIANAGYAEDPNYAKSLFKLIDKYNLTQYKQGTPYVPDDQIALLHKGEMVVPKEFNPANNGKVLGGEDLGEIIKLLKWGFDFLGKKLSEEKIVQAKSTNKQQLRSLKDPYQDFNLGW